MLDGWWGGLWESTGKRDQLHFNRVVRDHELELKTLKGNVRENDFFHWFSHPHPASAETQRLQKQWTGKTRKKKS